MKLNKYNTLFFYIFFCLFLFYLIVILWGAFIINKFCNISNINSSNIFSRNNNRNNNKEGFNSNEILFPDPYSPETSHSVNLPINDPISCSNFCGPKSQCLITREQCTSDVDCYGCRPYPPKEPSYLYKNIPKPDDDAGKLTWGLTPNYSQLTSGYGTKEKILYKGAENNKVPKTYEGVSIWSDYYDLGTKLLDDKLAYEYSAEPEQYKFLPNYPLRETTTGLFYDNGPSPSNAYL